MKKCLVIGANGYLGKHLSYFLSKEKILIDRYDIVSMNFDLQYLNLLDKSSLSKLSFDVDYIYLLSGATGTYNSFDEYETFVNVNEIGLINLLDAIRHSGYRPRIIFPSTRLIYKGSDSPLKETAEKETKTIYAVNKLACEGLLYSYAINFDIPYTIFRLCVPYGNVIDDNYSFGTVGFFVTQAKERGEICLYGDGLTKRTFTHIEDVCKQIIRASFLDDSLNETYNIGGATFSLFDLATLIANRFNANIKFVPWPDKDLRLESGHTYFDDSKIQLLLNGYSYHELEELNSVEL